jgi:hypothetical protein
VATRVRGTYSEQAVFNVRGSTAIRRSGTAGTPGEKLNFVVVKVPASRAKRLVTPDHNGIEIVALGFEIEIVGTAVSSLIEVSIHCRTHSA